MRFILVSIIFFLKASVSMANVSNNFSFISQIHAQRFALLLGELRCLVCQNQSLAESNAPLAQDLKREISQQISEGKSDEEIKKYLVSRYGQYILFKPQVNSATLILWLGPCIFLIGSFIILFFNIRKQLAAPVTNLS